MFPFDDCDHLIDLILACSVEHHLKELGMVVQLVGHHEFVLEEHPDLVMLLLFDHLSLQNRVVQMLVEFLCAFPEVSEFVDLDVTWQVATSPVDLEDLILLIIINEVIIAELLDHEVDVD